MFDFTSTTVCLTGAAGNLGRATAEAFVAAGADLVLIDHRLERLESAFSAWSDSTGVHLFAGDLTSEENMAALGESILGTVGHVDVLVNIAGGFKMGSPVHETDLATWESMLDLNARSVLLTARTFVPGMIDQGRGKIINIGARSGLTGGKNMAAYSVSKSAVIRLTESMAAELRGSGINVNCILPGTIDTSRNRAEMPRADFSKWVTPGALAQVILFLASPAADPLHGVAIPL